MSCGHQCHASIMVNMVHWINLVKHTCENASREMCIEHKKDLQSFSHVTVMLHTVYKYFWILSVVFIKQHKGHDNYGMDDTYKFYTEI